ncbi:MAG: efflux RND transporter periplasmic adaptor subunit [Endomicrobiales bacterium]|nr:efflux RND transporter periplasmic adaptor subunit [Endomicrobiales bacterium]
MKKIFIISGGLLIVAISLFFILRKDKNGREFSEIQPWRDEISISFRLSGEVKPRNRIEIKPQVSGRIEEILVVEGQDVKKGQVLAWMSSTERAALLDTVRSKSDEELSKWEDIYKPTPIISPMSGFIIARSKEPGQSVTVSDVILLLADKLIIEANVDETDLRHMKLNQEVSITLDAYPDKQFKGVVEHIAFDSEVISNVTVYKVKIKPLRIPENFRSGMTATVDVIAEKRDDALLLPAEAVLGRGERNFVFVKDKESGRKRTPVETGITDGKNIEIVSGINDDDIVLIRGKKSEKGEGDSGNSRRGGRGGLPFGRR